MRARFVLDHQHVRRSGLPDLAHRADRAAVLGLDLAADDLVAVVLALPQRLQVARPKVAGMPAKR